MSRVLHKSNPYDLSKSRKSPIHDHPLYSTTDHGQCAGCFEGKELSSEFLECPICDIFFHKDCIESKEEITHPFHPQHSLWLVKRESLPDTNLDRKCCLCGEEVMLLVYRCLKCDFKLDMSCAENPPLLEVVQPKVHQHSLHLLMKKVSFTCDACGLEGDRSPYVCLLCNFMFHIRCVYFPNDPRRRNGLNHGSQLVPGICGCGSVHSDVVACEHLRKERALEDVELDESPAQVVHVTHSHHILTFHRDGQVDDVYSRCDMCQLPVASTPYYCCAVCQFFLHERCVKLPMIVTSMLHNHPLKLEFAKKSRVTDLEFHEKYFSCNACGQFNDGVRYTCFNFNLDVGCASISLPFKSPAHQHPLTFISTNKKKCGVCELWASPVLSCDQCDFVLGFDCAQLPVLARHKYDKHVLNLDITRDKNRRDNYWCEICEKKVDMNEVFYTCDDKSCCSTFHTHCVVGGLNLKLGLSFTLFSLEFVVVSNTFAAPRLCFICGLRCKGPKVIKINHGGYTDDTDRFLCSSSCLMRNRHLLHNL